MTDSPQYNTKFTDTEGREWSFRVDGPLIQDVREQCGIDIAKLDQPEVWHQLYEDVELQVNVLHSLLFDQCREREIDARGFARAIGPGDVREHAVNAMMDAIELFFQPGRRSLWRSTCEMNREMLEEGMRQAIAKIQNPAMRQKMLQEMGHRMDSELQKTLTRLRSATQSQER